jgi:hypothetical protein
MTKMITIFRKDLRHLWPHILIFAGLLTVGAFTDPTYTHTVGSAAGSVIWYVSLFACWNLVIAVIHEEPLIGNRQHWLTQPYCRGCLITAKTVFILLSVNLPVFLMQWGVLALVGIPPLQELSALLWRQLFITAFLVMPAAALASVTKNLKQASLWVLAIIVPLFVLSFALFVQRLPALLLSPQWTASYWLKSTFSAVVAVLVGAAILYLQYFRRATGLARVVLTGGVATALLANVLAPSSKQFAVQELLSTRCSGCRGVHVELDPRGGRENRSYYYARERRLPGIVHVEIPIRIEGIPPGLTTLADRRPADLWCMGRKVYAEVDETPPGQLWLSVDMDSLFVNEHPDSDLDLQGAIKLTLFAPAASLPVDGAVAVPGIGVCSPTSDADGAVWLKCLTPARQAALALEFPGGGRQWMVARSSADIPFPVSFDFAPLEQFTSQAPFVNAAEVRLFRIITEQPYAHVHPGFQLRGIHLRAYTGRRRYR